MRLFVSTAGVLAGNGAAAELPIALRVDASSPRAVVVALHGIQTNAEWFKDLGGSLAERHISLRAVNVPGRGMAHPPPADARDWISDWVAPLKATAVKVHKETGLPVLLLGTSWGARPVLRAAADAGDGADWCRGVVLIAPALKTSADLKFAWCASLSPAAWFKSGSDTFRLPLHAQDYTFDPEVTKQWLDDGTSNEGAKLVREATLRHFAQTKGLRRDVKATLHSVKPPVLALFGSADTLVNLHAADMSLGNVSGTCETRIVKAGTHAMQLDRHLQLAELISDWLGRRVENKTVPHGTVHLDSRAQYFDCGMDVIQGRRYRFVLEKGQIWKDSQLKACDPVMGDPTLHKVGAGWLRRVRHDALDRDIRPRYFQPIVTIGMDDDTGIVVQPERPWTAARSGRLYAFANDANWNGARRNNHGFVTFRVLPAD